MSAIQAGLVLAVTLCSSAAQAASSGPEPTGLAAASSACTASGRFGQTHAALDRSIALAGRVHPGLDEYLALHAQARESIQRPAMLLGAELRARASRTEHAQH